MAKQRNAFLDNVKFVLILTVVIGHCLGLFSDNRTVLALYSLIYSFHMPLFMCISVFFTKVKDEKQFVRMNMNLFLIFIIHHSLRLLLLYYSGELYTFKQILSPQFGLWYLVSLIIYRIIYQKHYILINNNLIKIFSISIIASIFIGFIDGLGLCIQKTMNFFPYFIFGLIVQKYNLFVKITKVNINISISSLFIYYIILYLLNNNYCSFFYMEQPYIDYGFNVSLCALGKVILLPISFWLSACFLRIISIIKHSYQIDTLFVYIFHLWVIKPLISNVVDYFKLNNNFLFAFLFSILSLIIVFFLYRIKLLKKSLYLIRIH